MADSPNRTAEEESSSSSDDDYIDNDKLSPPQSLLYSHEQPEDPTANHPEPALAPAHALQRVHAPFRRLLHHSRDWTTKIYLLADGNILKERSSYPKLSHGYHATNELHYSLRTWRRELPELLARILGENHPYLSSISVPFVPLQQRLFDRRSNNNNINKTPASANSVVPEMVGGIVMERMRAVRPSVVMAAIEDILATPALRLEARRIPDNFDLYPKAWLGMQQTLAIANTLAHYPNFADRPAYLDQVLKFVGRRGVLELARQMGVALAAIHYDLGQDARDIKFRIGYEPERGVAMLWVGGLGRMDTLVVNEGGDGFRGGVDPACYV